MITIKVTRGPERWWSKKPTTTTHTFPNNTAALKFLTELAKEQRNEAAFEPPPEGIRGYYTNVGRKWWVPDERLTDPARRQKCLQGNKELQVYEKRRLELMSGHLKITIEHD